MSQFIDHLRDLVKSGDVRTSRHGYLELAKDEISADELYDGIASAAVVEENPDYPKGPCVLLLHEDGQGRPVHALWGIPKGHDKPVVLITAYRPDPTLWDETLLRRR